MKHLFIFIALLIAAISTQAQSGYEDVVYLKNGGIIRGTIIEQIPNESIKIKTKDRNIFVYKMDEILKITKEETHGAPGRAVKKREGATKENIKKSGYTNITEVVFGRSFENTSTTNTYGNSNTVTYSHFDDINNGPLLGAQTVNGYQFSPFFSMGAGIGIHVHSGLVLVPLFLDLRANFSRNRLTPFASVNIGYSYSRKEVTGGVLATDDKGGILFSPAAGMKFFVLPKMALNLSLGFRYQEIEVPAESYQAYANEYYENKILRHFILRFGFTF